MKQLLKIRLALAAICSIIFMAGCSDFPEELTMEGDITVEYGEPKLTGQGKYSLEVTINVNIEKASERIISAKISPQLFSSEKEMDFLNQLDTKTGGKAIVVFEDLEFNRENDYYIFVETEHFRTIRLLQLGRGAGTFCKTSDFKITSPSSANHGAIATFKIVECPNTDYFINLNLYIERINLATQEKKNYSVTSTPAPDAYQIVINNDEFNQKYKCALKMWNNGYDNVISDWIEYSTPGPLTTITENYCDNYDISFTIHNAHQYEGYYRIELWLRNDTSSAWKMKDVGRLNADDTVKMYHGGYQNSLYQVRYYLDNNLCAIKEGKISRY